MPDTQMIANLWPIILTLIFVVIWAVRLEAKNFANEKEVIRVEKEVTALQVKIESEHTKIDAKFETVASALTGIKESLARIEGRLSNKNECPIT